MRTSVPAMPLPSRPCDVMSVGISAGINYQRLWLHHARSGRRVAPQPAPPILRKRTSPLLVGPRSRSFTVSSGQCVAPEKIENVLHTSWFVAQAIVFGDEHHDSLVAVIVPEDYALYALAKKLTIATSSFAELCEHPTIVHLVLRDLVVVSKEGNLCGFETVRAITLLPRRFTAESGVLLRSCKVDRGIAKARFRPYIDAMHATSDEDTQRKRPTRSA
ncbi:hypothetical protein H310_11351 [Aphanomyces invadans]|uniref:AMP-binding enzyme C-terminal domain-containing protein n=1 Tax=Aphanomyces invadans TaxID=157072 RepID=A0A024TLZ6_9STRA|nr:hypothetical protein H310_11351 [Aphanomyces invadans]ETV95053.1 hypothetical protein H310_11351 [Aphanomyces invadans]|eukprot:XP_008876226.1 hypothetical protein H310_11351 [Aphanomyces invadans]